MFKVYKNISPALIANLFHVKQTGSNLIHNSYFAIPNVKFMYDRTKRLSNLGSRIWTVVPDKLRQLVHIYTLKKKLKSGTHAGYVKLT